MTNNEKYDYLIVGSGLFAAVCVHELTKRGKKCLVVERRAHLGGNVYTEQIAGINVHRYGPHIFHTSDREVWDFVQQFATFNHYIAMPVARYQNELYNLPFNMNTFTKLWPDVFTPEQAAQRIAAEREAAGITEPKNLEEQAISSVGRTIFEKLIQGYTEKQWGRPCDQLPASIIKRLPVRYIFDNNYFNDPYQGIPVGGYTAMVQKMFGDCEIRLHCDYLAHREELDALAREVIYTGAIDEYFDYCYGALEYRRVRFETEELPVANYQGNAWVTFTSKDVPYTRIIEHKHFEFGTQPTTVISREYPVAWQRGDEPYYPINDEKNNALYARYKALAEQQPHLHFGGRLGLYRYLDMDKTIRAALDFVRGLA